MLIRSVLISGWLHHLRLIFPAVRGNDLLLDATAFVPDAGYAEVWGTLPSFLGMQGCLDRLRFAVDPVTDTFYFGPLSWE
ncbi:MAG: hypothetical protein CVU38_11935 [Chloroflexi bacterium HGW-Chloroflexi-1]|nr:MAG: hypothetical protein CVU38_11935 [Chloroflexi bacterium HGW-Chloroflexi-1]